MFTPTEDSKPGLSPTVPMPRMRAVVIASLPSEVTVSPGVKIARFLILVMPASCTCCALIATTEIGTSCRFWERFSAVTMISSNTGALDVSAARAWAPAKAPDIARTSEMAREVTVRLVIGSLWVSAVIAYLEAMEIVAQAQRFVRHLIDKCRHMLDLTARRT